MNMTDPSHKSIVSYDIQTYLLDKSNIQDTITRMMHSFDTKDSSTLINLVYTPEFYLDYDQKLLNSQPEATSSEAWAKRSEHMHDPYDTTQHIVHNLLIELPQPTIRTNTSKPESCTVYAYAHGWFYNRDDEGRPRIMARRNGGKYRMKVVRLKDVEEHGGNPWRISEQHVELSWQDLADQ